MATVYQINKGVARPIEFKGFKAQYIAWLAVGLVVLLLLFAVLYISGLALVILLPVIIGSGGVLFYLTFYLSKRFGQYGLMKHLAAKGLPKGIRFRTRRTFASLKYPKY